MKIWIIAGLVVMIHFVLFAQDWNHSEFELRYLEQSVPMRIDPITVYDVTSVRITEILFGALYSTDRSTARIPEFADGEPRLSEDGMSAVVKLKPDLKFSDGTPIRVSDIIFTWKAATNPKSFSPNRQMYRNIANISALDSSTIRVTFRHPVSDARRYLMFFIVPKSIFLSTEIDRDLTYCREPDPTSGGYRIFNKKGTGQEFLFVKNPYYNGKTKPSIEKIRMNVHTDILGHVDNLRNGLADLIPFVPPAKVPVIKQDSRFKIELYDANQFDFIAFNLENEFLKFQEIRQAINMAFNRKEILASFFNDDGDLMSGPFPPTHSGFNPDVQPWPYDPNMARTMLQNMGFEDSDGDGILEYNGKPLEFNMLTALCRDPDYSSVISSFVEQMRNIGIRINTQEFLYDAFESKVRKGDFDMVYYTRKVTQEADYSPFFMSDQIGIGGKNIGRYSNPLVDSLFVMANSTLDFQKRVELYKEVHKIIHDDCPYVFLWYLKYHAAYIRELKNVSIDPYYFFTTIEEWFYMKD